METIDDQFLWAESYRPCKIADCILPQGLAHTFQSYVDRKEIPNLILCGSSGTGKTSVARALCQEVGSDYILINGSDESGIDVLRTKIKSFASSVSLLSDGKKVVIIDEADYLNPNSTQPAFRGVIEEFAGNCSFIFTCNQKNRIIPPLHSRCAVIDFTIPDSEKAEIANRFFTRIQEILTANRIAFQPKVLPALIIKFFPDFRRTLNELQRYAASGKIDDGIITATTDVRINEVVDFLKSKDFRSLRKWVGVNASNDQLKIMREVYDRLYEILKPESIPVAVVIIGRYSYQAAFVADQEINLMSCLTEIMLECEVK